MKKATRLKALLPPLWPRSLFWGYTKMRMKERTKMILFLG
jgi:hypothetical protein